MAEDPMPFIEEMEYPAFLDAIKRHWPARLPDWPRDYKTWRRDHESRMAHYRDLHVAVRLFPIMAAQFVDYCKRNGLDGHPQHTGGVVEQVAYELRKAGEAKAAYERDPHSGGN